MPCTGVKDLRLGYSLNRDKRRNTQIDTEKFKSQIRRTKRRQGKKKKKIRWASTNDSLARVLPCEIDQIKGYSVVRRWKHREEEKEKRFLKMAKLTT